MSDATYIGLAVRFGWNKMQSKSEGILITCLILRAWKLVPFDISDLSALLYPFQSQPIFSNLTFQFEQCGLRV